MSIFLLTTAVDIRTYDDTKRFRYSQACALRVADAIRGDDCVSAIPGWYVAVRDGGVQRRFGDNFVRRAARQVNYYIVVLLTMLTASFLGPNCFRGRGGVG